MSVGSVTLKLEHHCLTIVSDERVSNDVQTCCDRKNLCKALFCIDLPLSAQIAKVAAMRLQISDLTTERQWRAAIGYDQAKFGKLLVLFTASYLELHGKSVAQRHADLQVTPSLQTEEELLFFTLFSLKAGLTYDVLGFVSGMDASNAKRNQSLGVRVLEHALQTAGHLPQRSFKDAAEFAAYLQKEETLIFDGVEQRIQRPGENEAQKDHYSGKKSVTPSKPSR